MWQWVTTRCRSTGVPLVSFNGDFDAQLARARGHLLILTVVGDRPSGTLVRHLDDGTQVLLVYARDLELMRAAVDALPCE